MTFSTQPVTSSPNSLPLQELTDPLTDTQSAVDKSPRLESTDVQLERVFGNQPPPLRRSPSTDTIEAGSSSQAAWQTKPPAGNLSRTSSNNEGNASLELALVPARPLQTQPVPTTTLTSTEVDLGTVSLHELTPSRAESTLSHSTRMSTPDETQPPPLEMLNLEAQVTPSNRASLLAYFAAQAGRHFIPVTGSRTLAQGLAAPAVAGLIESHPDGALAVQIALGALSLLRELGSTFHSEREARVATNAFLGEPPGSTEDHTARRAWQAIQRTGVVAGDAVAIAMTMMARNDPRFVAIAQSLALVQVRAHLLSMGREFLRPAFNTVKVGNPHAPVPETGRNLTSDHIGRKEKLSYGVSAGAIELVSQLLMQVTLGGQSAWKAGYGLSIGAGAIAGVANTLSSSVEDTIIDTAVEKKLKQTDPGHERTVQWNSKNPLQLKELARQLERVDVRVFNQMVPAMISTGILYAMSGVLDSDVENTAAKAGINSVVNGVMLGALLLATTSTYQTNDALREHYAYGLTAPT